MSMSKIDYNYCCKDFHNSCLELIFLKIKIEFVFCFKLYLAYYSLTNVFSQFKQLKNGQFFAFIKKIIINSIRSTIFLASAVVIYRITNCIVSRLFGTVNFLIGLGQTLLMIIGVLAESKTRIASYALFMLPKGLESCVDLMIKNGLKEIPYSFSLLFSLSMAVLIKLNDNQLIDSRYKDYLDKLLY